MEQPESSAPSTESPAAVPRRSTPIQTPPNHQTPSNPRTTTATSSSVPTLRFPRPLGNRELTNWVSSSSPDIMSHGNFTDEGQMDSSIADLGYEFVGTDGDSQPESYTSSCDQPVADDIQSLVDTDTGTDADTNDVDTESSDEDDIIVNHPAALPPAGEHYIDEDVEAHMENMAARSLDHPTELFSPGVDRQDQGASGSDEHAELQTTEEGRLVGELDSDQPNLPTKETVETPTRPQAGSTSTSLLVKASKCFGLCKRAWKQDSSLRKDAFRITITLVVLCLSSIALQYLNGGPRNQDVVLSTVPVASVVSLTKTETFTSTATVTSTLTSTATLNALQTGSSSKSQALIPAVKSREPAAKAHTRSRQPLCSVELYSRNEILLRVPEHHKSAWLSKQSLMISVSRGATDVALDSTKVSSVDGGFLIEIPQDEAHGSVDVTIATTRKPHINETFNVNFVKYKLVDAFGTSKQLVMGLAQTLADTVNDTTAWLEKTCTPALDSISREVSRQTGSLFECVTQGLQEVGNAALQAPDRLITQFRGKVKDFDKEKARAQLLQARSRFLQTEAELRRQARDIRDELSLRLLQGQLNSKLWWLKMRGQHDEYERYLAAAKPYYHKKRADAELAALSRAQAVQEEIRARRQKEQPEVNRPFWRAGLGDL